MIFTTRTHQNNTKLLTAEFTKKIVVFKNTANSGLRHFKAEPNIQIFETI